MELLIGRYEEQSVLQKAFDSNEAELIALYGRRRVGKTFLVRHFFATRGLFVEITGLKDGTIDEQLDIFSRSFQAVFPQAVPLPPLRDWRYAFELLTAEIRRLPRSKKITVFFDELPWLATRKSRFLQQLDHFWNTEWSKMNHLTVILCGSAASWMIEKIVHAKGGLHNRLTRTLILKPFTLSETRNYLQSRKIRLNLAQILELYLVFGGVPYYLKQIEKGLSATQNINKICFLKNGTLFDEFHKLYASLFKDSSYHEKIIRAVATRRQGISRDQLIKQTGIPSGTGLNNYLYELEEAGFLASFVPYHKSKKNIYYRIIDEYTYFFLKWVNNAPKGIFSTSDHHYWEKKSGTTSWKSWAGHCFEGVCLKHSLQIKKALQIGKIPTEVASWRYMSPKGAKEKGAQIDLLFDRGDGIISICEIKYCNDKFVINKSYADELRNKMDVFKRKTVGNKKHLFLVMVTTFGIEKNRYSEELVTNEVTLEDLFSES